MAHTMHPVLVEVPWPELGVALWPALVLLACFGAVTGVVAARRQNPLVAALGGMLAALALTLAIVARTSRIAIGPLEVRSWGVAFASAILVGSVLFIRRADARGLQREFAVRACIAITLGGLIGARVVWVLLHPAATGSLEAAAAFYQGGLSVWGGIAGALIGAKVASQSEGVSLSEISDLAAPSFGAGVLLVRVGCFFEGCDFGVPLGSGAPRFLSTLGTFPKDSPAWALHVLSRGLPASAPSSLPVHPTELYEAVGGGALVAVAFALDRLGLRSGLTFAGMATAYLLLRVSLDWLRDDPVEMWVSGTLLSLSVLAYGFFRLRARTL
jgi:phosphatidylglycerol:prolipoprotein diacylglycerol transferase